MNIVSLYLYYDRDCYWRFSECCDPALSCYSPATDGWILGRNKECARNKLHTPTLALSTLPEEYPHSWQYTAVFLADTQRVMPWLPWKNQPALPAGWTIDGTFIFTGNSCQRAYGGLSGWCLQALLLLNISGYLIFSPVLLTGLIVAWEGLSPLPLHDAVTGALVASFCVLIYTVTTDKYANTVPFGPILNLGGMVALYVQALM